jgi:hypothetical protein
LNRPIEQRMDFPGPGSLRRLSVLSSVPASWHSAALPQTVGCEVEAFSICTIVSLKDQFHRTRGERRATVYRKIQGTD